MVKLTNYEQPEILLSKQIRPKGFKLIDERNQDKFVEIFNSCIARLPDELKFHPILFASIYRRIFGVIPYKVTTQIILTRTSIIINNRVESKIYSFNLDNLEILYNEQKAALKGNGFVTDGAFISLYTSQSSKESDKIKELELVLRTINSLKLKGSWLVEAKPFIKSWKKHAFLPYHNALGAIRDKAYSLGRNCLLNGTKANPSAVAYLVPDSFDQNYPNLSKALEIDFQEGFNSAYEGYKLRVKKKLSEFSKFVTSLLSELQKEVDNKGRECFEECKEPDEYLSVLQSKFNTDLLEFCSIEDIEDWFFKGYNEQIEILKNEAYSIGYNYGYSSKYLSRRYINFFYELTHSLDEQPQAEKLIRMMTFEFELGSKEGAKGKHEKEEDRKKREAEWEREDQKCM
ncbi:hypothetical protein [Pontibacter harenae]|uniref:hypothetical protein n=1 Tax=Pontibacter harenae TaxID=2894083 RepID=UPI001E49531D|nr:hypothetical protein [Pontibacter harenae]MCC9167219.1 hypothetical protein [Pontibacter harenae]